MEQVTSLQELTDVQRRSSSLDIPGTLAKTFGQSTLSATIPVSKLFSVYEVDLEVQRSIHPGNLSKLMDYIMLYLDDRQPIYFPGMILSARGVGEYDEQDGVYRLQPMDKLFVIDGQHRLAACVRLMETLQSSLVRAKEQLDVKKVDQLTDKLRKLYSFPMSTLIYLDIAPHQERQLFSDINKLPRKIGGNLAVLRDQRPFYHVLATRLIESDPVVGRLEIDTFSERGKGEGFHFSYHFVIELLIAFFEGRLKPIARNNVYQFTDDELKVHAEQASIYVAHLMDVLPKPDPNSNPLVWNEDIQIALAMVMHDEAMKSGSFNKYALEHAMKLVPHIPWERMFAAGEDQLPRRAKTMHVYDCLKQFYRNGDIILLDEREVN